MDAIQQITRKGTGKRIGKIGRWVGLGVLLTTCGVVAATTTLADGQARQVGPTEPTEQAGQAGQAGQDELAKALGAAGITLCADGQTLGFPATVEVRRDALEYLLVNPHGAAHEALFVTPVDAEMLSAAFLLAGAEAGENVRYEEVDPAPTREQMMDGAETHDVIAPSGKPIYVYAAWREPAGPIDSQTGELQGESIHFHRIEDLVLDLDRQRTLRRHGWVWLGSKMVPGMSEGAAERFAASASGNLICTTFFAAGETLLTTAVPECASQTIWYPNSWLLPPRGSEVVFIASSTELATLPDDFAGSLPMCLESDRRR